MTRRVVARLSLLAALAACNGDGPQVPTTFTPAVGSTAQFTGVVAGVVATPPQVQILDAKGKGIKGATVRWRPGANSGRVVNDSTTTDASGTALSGGWTLGTSSGTQTLTATADGVTPVTFTVLVSPGPVANLVRISTDQQQATVNAAVTDVPQVRAQDIFGNPVPGVAITFSVAFGGGTITGAQQTSDANGLARVGAWTLGTTAGQQVLQANALNASQAVWVATAVAGPLADLVKYVGDNAQGLSGIALSPAPGVKAVDAFGNPIGNIPVTFTPGANSGTVTNGTVTTDLANGIAIVGSWVLGTTPTQTLVATTSALPGKSATFTATAVNSQFNLEVRFIGDGGTDRQRLAFTRAAAKWRSIIVGHVHQVTVNVPAADCRFWIPAITETVNDLVIYARIAAIDGVNNILGQASVCYIGSQSRLPAVGFMEFDQVDLPGLEASGVIDDVVMHEMGHVLGVGSLWAFRGFTAGAGTTDPSFTGAGARTQFTIADQVAYTGNIVPIHNANGAGSREVHWRYPLFGRELMNPFAQNGGMPLSRITAASLADLGYTVNFAGCDPYTLTAASSMLAPFGGPIFAFGNDVPTDVVVQEIFPNGTRRPLKRQ